MKHLMMMLLFSVCMTTKSKECKFPFKYKGKTYSSCTTKGSKLGKAWCSTSTNDDGTYNGKWGYCDIEKCSKENKGESFINDRI